MRSIQLLFSSHSRGHWSTKKLSDLPKVEPRCELSGSCCRALHLNPECCLLLVEAGYRWGVEGWAGAGNESGDWCSSGLRYPLRENVVFHSRWSVETLKAHKQEKNNNNKIESVLLKDNFGGWLFWGGNEQSKCKESSKLGGCCNSLRESWKQVFTEAVALRVEGRGYFWEIVRIPLWF